MFRNAGTPWSFGAAITDNLPFQGNLEQEVFPFPDGHGISLYPAVKAANSSDKTHNTGQETKWDVYREGQYMYHRKLEERDGNKGVVLCRRKIEERDWYVHNNTKIVKPTEYHFL